MFLLSSMLSHNTEYSFTFMPVSVGFFLWPIPSNWENNSILFNETLNSIVWGHNLWHERKYWFYTKRSHTSFEAVGLWDITGWVDKSATSIPLPQRGVIYILFKREFKMILTHCNCDMSCLCSSQQTWSSSDSVELVANPRKLKYNIEWMLNSTHQYLLLKTPPHIKPL